MKRHQAIDDLDDAIKNLKGVSQGLLAQTVDLEAGLHLYILMQCLDQQIKKLEGVQDWLASDDPAEKA